MPAEQDPSAAGHKAIDPTLLNHIERIIRAHPEGLTEHALIAELRKAQIEPFTGSNLRAPLSLFRTHFLLFHCLYRLRDDRLPQGEWLRIDCLDIGLEGSAQNHHGNETQDTKPLMMNDPVRNYYLDLSRLDNTDAAAIEALLGNFWRHMNHKERRSQALDVLGLEDPVDNHAIQSRYRSLVQRHHPDRGGDAGQIQRFNEARWILLAAD